MEQRPDHDHPDPLTLVLDLLAQTAAAPTPAQVRAALRRASPEELAATAGAARTAARALETIETTAGTLARAHGVDDALLSAATGRAQRSLQRRYPKQTLRVQRPGLDQRALLAYDATGRPRPVEAELDLADGLLRLTSTPLDPLGADAAPILRWPLPLLTGAGGANLLEAITSRAQRVLISADPDPGAETFTLDEDARAAADEIGRICEEAAMSYPVLRQVEARNHFAGQEPVRVAAALGLPEGAGPEQVAVAAELARENALGRLILLTGVEDYLQAALTPAEEGETS